MGKSPLRKSPRKNPRSPNVVRAVGKDREGGTPKSRQSLHRKLAEAFQEDEQVEEELASALDADEDDELATSTRSTGRLAPKAVAFKSPPRAVFADASEARRARLKARTHHLPLSDKDASAHLQRLSEPPPRFQGYEAAVNVRDCEPIPCARCA